MDLSEDQKPDTPDEMKRIKKRGGFVSPPEEEWGGPARVWLDAKMTQVGLAMARSIGDHLVKPIGVIAQPEVKTRVLTPEDKFIVMASDGVWEFLTNQSVADMILKFTDPLDVKEAKSATCRVLGLQQGCCLTLTLFFPPFMILLAGLIQGRKPRLLSANSHQGAVGAPGCVVTLGLQGVVNHEQHTRIHGCRSSGEPVGQCTVPLRGPPLFGIRGRQLNATLAAHTPDLLVQTIGCLLYTSPSPRDRTRSRMPSSA